MIDQDTAGSLQEKHLNPHSFRIRKKKRIDQLLLKKTFTESILHLNFHIWIQFEHLQKPVPTHFFLLLHPFLSKQQVHSLYPQGPNAA